MSRGQAHHGVTETQKYSEKTQCFSTAIGFASTLLRLRFSSDLSVTLCLRGENSLASYFVVTSVTLSAGYSWFHCSEMVSNVRRKGLLWPGARGETPRSTASG